MLAVIIKTPNCLLIKIIKLGHFGKLDIENNKKDTAVL